MTFKGARDSIPDTNISLDTPRLSTMDDYAASAMFLCWQHGGGGIWACFVGIEWWLLTGVFVLSLLRSGVRYSRLVISSHVAFISLQGLSKQVARQSFYWQWRLVVSIVEWIAESWLCLTCITLSYCWQDWKGCWRDTNVLAFSIFWDFVMVVLQGSYSEWVKCRDDDERPETECNEDLTWCKMTGTYEDLIQFTTICHYPMITRRHRHNVLISFWESFGSLAWLHTVCRHCTLHIIQAESQTHEFQGNSKMIRICHVSPKDLDPFWCGRADDAAHTTVLLRISAAFWGLVCPAVGMLRMGYLLW